MSKDTVDDAVSLSPTANGLALIIANDYVNTGLKPLKGTIKDGEKMRRSLSELNFATLFMQNASTEDTVSLLRSAANFAKYPTSYRRIVVVFSGHGTVENKLYAGDGFTISIDDIIDAFLPHRAPHVGSTPKIFLIDACRGKQTDRGTLVPKGGEVVECLKVPSTGNFLVAYSTTPNHLAFESEGGGVWMSALADKIVSTNKSILDVLTDVNEEMTARLGVGTSGGHIQQPELVSRLTESVNLLEEAMKTRNKENLCQGTPEDSNLSDKNRQSDEMPLQSRENEGWRDIQKPLVFQMGIYPTLRATDYVCKLKKYCYSQNKLEPRYQISKLGRSLFVATVYVNKTCGRVKGREERDEADARESAARLLLQKLGVECV